MRTRFCLWWRSIRTHIVVALLSALIGVFALIIWAGYWLKWGWTGFSAKTLWDWLQLLVVPMILAIGGFWLNQLQKSREERLTEQRAEIERKAAEQRAQTEHEIAADNQREMALQAYLDTMSELLFERRLRESQPEDEVRTIARARTLTVLPRLDANRKRTLLQFLYEARLIHISAGGSIIKLKGVDLSGANLAQTNLSQADLSGAILQEAILDWANLSGARLSKTNLSQASLLVTNLSGADLSGALLSQSNLSEAYLNTADLSVVNLAKADLQGATLSGANLSGADLSDANLSQADLSEADLSRATLTLEQVERAKSLKGTIMPDTSTHS